MSSKLVFFQFKLILTPLKKIAGNIKGRKTILKYGAPTEISVPVTISIISGHNVPRSMVAAEAHKKILFNYQFKLIN